MWCRTYRENVLLLYFFNDIASNRRGRETSEQSMKIWQQAADKLKKNLVQRVTLAVVDCAPFGRLCHMHKTIKFPLRDDIWPQGVLFSAKHPNGNVVRLKNKETTWNDVVSYLDDSDRAFVHEMIDSNEAVLSSTASASSEISEDEFDEL